MNKLMMIFMLNCLYVNLYSTEKFTVKSANIPLLEQAWQINTSGHRQVPSYYALFVNDRLFPGLRQFEVRWDMISNLLEYEGTNVLELGCCVALPSTLLKKYRGVANAVAVDMATHRLDAAKLVARAFQVDVNFHQLHFDTDEYELALGYDFDVVICMSLINWVQDKERLMAYLSHFNHVIFEGHEHPQFEIARFARYGFDNYDMIGVSDFGRAIIHFYK